MSGSTSFLIYVAFFASLVGGAGLSQSASAGKWSDKCEQAGKKSEAACKGASNGAKAVDTAQANGNIAGVGSSSTVNPAAGALQQQAKDQAGRLTAAKNKCEEEKNDCEKKCEEEEKKRQSKENLPDGPNGPPPEKVEAKADKGPLKEKKQSACIAPIMAMMGDLGSGAADASKAAADSGKTGGSSGGMPPMPPMPPPGGGDKKEDATKPDPAVTPVLNCETEGYAKYSDCNGHYITKCETAMNSPTCEPFIARYCGANTPAQPTMSGNDSLSLSAQSTAAAAATANLVADKQGEGLGSAFCKKVTAYRFCQMAGRQQCPSCKNQNSAWASNNNAGQLADAQKTCPTDPVFLDPAVLKQVNGATGIGTSAPAAGSTTSATDRLSSAVDTPGVGGGTGGGAMGGAGGAGSTANNPTGGVHEGAYTGPSLADGAGYGGGGGGGASDDGSASGPGYDPASVNGIAKRGPAATLASQGGPKDVAVQYGPSVFSIQSTTYRDMCAKGRFLHCRR